MSVLNTTGGNATLWAWIDFNNDGVVDAGETQTATVASSGAQQTVVLPSFAVPTGAANSTYARFRLGTVLGEVTVPTGLAINGEVEDYVVTTKAIATAATLSYFRAVSGNGGRVQLSWGTLTELDLLGFRVERTEGASGWTAVTTEMIPAQGRGYTPQAYRYEDGAGLGAQGYRLVGVTLRGGTKMLGEATVRAAGQVGAKVSEGNLQVEYRGQPNATVVVESATDVVNGPWEAVETIRLDGSGAASVQRALESGEPMRFYRVRE